MVKLTRIGVLALAVALVAAACSSGSTDTTTAGAGGSGTILISGSSTVEPVSARVAEAFSASNSNVAIDVKGPGTGDGFAAFCSGETDISDASRPIKDSEADACSQAGIDWIELKIAIDGLSVLTSHDNESQSCLTFNDMYALVGPESIGFGKWSDAADLAAELGRTTPDVFIDQDLVVTAPGEESGTYDSFVEIVLEDTADERGEDAASRPDYQASANDNVIIEGIAGSQYSFGWVGYAFYLANQDKVKALAVDGGDGCVEPTPETIADGSYPIARPLFIYVNKQKAEQSQVLADFVDFYLSDEGLASVGEAGYVDLADYTDTRDTWEGRVTGRVFS